MTEIKSFVNDFTDDVMYEFKKLTVNIDKEDMFTRGKIQRVAMFIVAARYFPKEVFLL